MNYSILTRSCNWYKTAIKLKNYACWSCELLAESYWQREMKQWMMLVGVASSLLRVIDSRRWNNKSWLTASGFRSGYLVNFYGRQQPHIPPQSAQEILSNDIKVLHDNTLTLMRPRDFREIFLGFGKTTVLVALVVKFSLYSSFRNGLRIH